MGRRKVEHFLALPTGVGVNRDVLGCIRNGASAPHRRGGEPPDGLTWKEYSQRSPQAWG